MTTPSAETCIIANCGKAIFARGWCSAHYTRWKRHGDPLAGRAYYRQPNPVCVEQGCDRPSHATGLCSTHYGQRRVQVAVSCAVEGCEEPVTCRGWCGRHYQRYVKYGAPLAGPAFRRRRGTGLPNWAYWQRRSEDKAAAAPDLLAYREILRYDPCSCGGPCEHIDHIEPFKHGGRLVVDNVTAACGSCNQSKGASSLLEYLLWK